LEVAQPYSLKPPAKGGVLSKVKDRGFPGAAKVPEVLADEHACSLVFGEGPEVTSEVVLGPMTAGAGADVEAPIVAANIDPVATASVRRLVVVVAVILDCRHPGDVNQSIVGT
jgi:hypothetical protein